METKTKFRQAEIELILEDILELKRLKKMMRNLKKK